ncbi:MAG: hypothetical protein AB8C84_12625 [Oligoflexales bacterium]
MNQLAISILKSVVMILLFASCGAQTEERDAVKKVVKDTETVSAASATTLAISAGSLEGTEVNIPLGALPENASVSADLTDTPSDFVKTAADGSTISSASSSLNVAATNDSGENISTLTSPMTIAISYASPAASLNLVDANDDNLCAFLKSEAGLFVWRKSHITISNGKAEFATRYLGTFQLTFCGQEKIEGFSEIADNPEVAGSSLKLTIDSSIMAYGATQHCLVLIDGGSEGTGEDHHTIHGTAVAAADGTKNTLELSYLANNLSPGTVPFIVILFQNSGDTCITEQKTTENFQPTYSRIVAFPTTTEKLTAGIDGTLGSDDFALTTYKIDTGTPEGNTEQYSTTPAEKMCSAFDAGDNGFAELNLTSTSDGLLNAAKTVDMIIPTSAKETYSASIEVGHYCDGEHSNTTATTDYKLSLKTPKDDKYSLIAIKITTGTDSCIQLYQGNAYDKKESPLTSINIPTSGSRVAFIPWDNKERNTTSLNPIYDIVGFPKSLCSAASGTPTAIERYKEMTTEINVQPPAIPGL